MTLKTTERSASVLAKACTTMKVPKRLHAVWFGSDIPEAIQHRFQRWLSANRGYELKVWNESNSPTHLPYLERALRHRKWANASNLIRLWALVREGGVYLDTDVDVVRPLDALLADECFLGFETPPECVDFVVNNAVIGSVAGHSFVQRCLAKILTDFDGTEEADQSSPKLTTEILKDLGLKNGRTHELVDAGLVIHPKEVFYPWGYGEQPIPSSELSEKTLTVHHWNKTWAAPTPHKIERFLTRILTAGLFALDEAASLSPKASRMLEAARSRAAMRRLRVDGRVQSGLFRGLRLSSSLGTGSSINPKLIGTYEYSVQRTLAGWAARGYSQIFNLGCECGVILAGLARLFPEARLHGYDLNPDACRIAQANTVDCSLRCQIYCREFSWHDLRPDGGRSLMICDIEGGEGKLFTAGAEHLPDDLIVELHEFSDPDVTVTLKKALAETHEIETVGESTPELFNLHLPSFIPANILSVCSAENRPVRMQWLIAQRIPAHCRTPVSGI